MQTIYVLNQEVAFEFVAQILIESDLDLVDVLSCTFPSRPEPKSAIWKSKSGKKVIGYQYKPDIELRYLQLLDIEWDQFQRGSLAPITLLFAGKIPIELFSTWDQLIVDLASENYRKVVRAAWAFHFTTIAGDESVAGLSRLMEGLNSNDELTRRVVSEALVEVATWAEEGSIREMLGAEPSPDVRLHLRRGIDRIMSRM